MEPGGNGKYGWNGRNRNTIIWGGEIRMMLNTVRGKTENAMILCEPH